MKKIVLGLVLAGMVSGSAGAQDVDIARVGGGGAVWTQKNVEVRIYAGDYGTPILVEAVEGIAAALPGRGPNLRISRFGPKDCDSLREQRFKKPTITICEQEPTWYAGSTWLRDRHGMVKGDQAWVDVVWSGDRDYDRNTACHEMMHAISWVDDDYQADRDSCVHGDNPTPGRWDRDYLAAVYQRHDTKKNGKERRTEGRRNGKQGKKHR